MPLDPRLLEPGGRVVPRDAHHGPGKLGRVHQDLGPDLFDSFQRPPDRIRRHTILVENGVPLGPPPVSLETVGHVIPVPRVREERDHRVLRQTRQEPFAEPLHRDVALLLIPNVLVVEEVVRDEQVDAGTGDRAGRAHRLDRHVTRVSRSFDRDARRGPPVARCQLGKHLMQLGRLLDVRLDAGE